MKFFAVYMCSTNSIFERWLLIRVNEIYKVVDVKRLRKIVVKTQLFENLAYVRITAGSDKACAWQKGSDKSG